MSKASTKSPTSKRTGKNGKQLGHSSTDLRAGKTGKELGHASTQSRAGKHSPIPQEEGIQDTGPSLYSQLKLLIMGRDRVPQRIRTYLEPRIPKTVRQGQWFDHRVILMVLAVKGVVIFVCRSKLSSIREQSPPDTVRVDRDLESLGLSAAHAFGRVWLYQCRNVEDGYRRFSFASLARATRRLHLSGLFGERVRDFGFGIGCCWIVVVQTSFHRSFRPTGADFRMVLADFSNKLLPTH